MVKLTTCAGIIVLIAAAVKVRLSMLSQGLHVSPKDLSGREYLITGGTSGLGMWHARRLYEMNANVVIAARNLPKAEKIVQEMRAGIKSKGTIEVAPAPLDLASLDSVRKFAEAWISSGRKLHVLVNNAAELGPNAGEGGPLFTSDGFERCFQINYLSHFLLTELLLPVLKQNAPSRIVHVSAKAHEWADLKFDNDMQVKDKDVYEKRASGPMSNLMGSYADSKLLQIMHSAHLGRRLVGTGVATHSLHPAIVATNLMSTATKSGTKDFMKIVIEYLFLKGFGRLIGFTQSEDDAVNTQLHVSIADALAAPTTPRYYSPLSAPLENCGKAAEDCGVDEVSPTASDTDLQDRVYKESCRLAGIQP
eukprot:TRINITY_DN19425_c0_g1_i1.p1 TRINITY_DN19425_c0_g1~~TRINITY_DN19425_c0_g1_i1.p1  ORF type:complete len:364 (-),score=54.40 TRINITY_DN19425_c0_g1_i1:28-1119(-)